jgi:hypothetical protein
MLVTTLLAVSFSLIRTSGFPREPAESWQFNCFWAGLYLLAGTIGGSAGYLAGAKRGAAIGAVVLVFFLWVVFMGLPVIY